jgi:hypothetical protein
MSIATKDGFIEQINSQMSEYFIAEEAYLLEAVERQKKSNTPPAFIAIMLFFFFFVLLLGIANSNIYPSAQSLKLDELAYAKHIKTVVAFYFLGAFGICFYVYVRVSSNPKKLRLENAYWQKHQKYCPNLFADYYRELLAAYGSLLDDKTYPAEDETVILVYRFSDVSKLNFNANFFLQPEHTPNNYFKKYADAYARLGLNPQTFNNYINLEKECIIYSAESDRKQVLPFLELCEADFLSLFALAAAQKIPLLFQAQKNNLTLYLGMFSNLFFEKLTSTTNLEDFYSHKNCEIVHAQLLLLKQFLDCTQAIILNPITFDEN